MRLLPVLVGLVLIILGLVPGVRVIIDYIETGLVPRLPSAVLAVGLVLTGVLSIVVGLILHTISRRFRELDSQLQSFADDVRQESNAQARYASARDASTRGHKGGGM